jgi:uncharacterized SAM-binding protein YcdF (DUF218 family)
MRTLIALFVVILLWTEGLFAFADRVIDSTPAVMPAEPADAIVVLTGASDLRLKAGMRLLERRKGARMFISGVNPEVKRPELMAVTEGSKRLYECCVDLGYEAELAARASSVPAFGSGAPPLSPNLRDTLRMASRPMMARYLQYSSTMMRWPLRDFHQPRASRSGVATG